MINGASVAIIDGDTRYTWRQTRERIARLGTGLRAIGCRDGDRVAILGLNSHRYFECIFAAPWAGGVMVPINIRLAPPEMAHCLNDAGTSILFVDETFLPVVGEIAGQMDSLREIVFMGEGTGEGCSAVHEALISDNEPMAPADRGPDDLSGLFYTGGTTGLSKGVMLSHANQVINALQTRMAFDMAPMNSGVVSG